jgi:hypothetical protein
MNSYERNMLYTGSFQPTWQLIDLRKSGQQNRYKSGCIIQFRRYFSLDIRVHKYERYLTKWHTYPEPCTSIQNIAFSASDSGPDLLIADDSWNIHGQSSIYVMYLAISLPCEPLSWNSRKMCLALAMSWFPYVCRVPLGQGRVFFVLSILNEGWFLGYMHPFMLWFSVLGDKNAIWTVIHLIAEAALCVWRACGGVKCACDQWQCWLSHWQCVATNTVIIRFRCESESCLYETFD